ncbi:MAG: epoxyqueuosine reductase [bacterium]|nr:epoxyqueuosine reductase [bacterium]
MGLREEVLGIAEAMGMDLVGIARVSDVVLAHPPRPAEDLLPGARTTVVFARSLLWAALNCPRGTKGALTDALSVCDHIDATAGEVAAHLEAAGFASYFAPSTMPVDIMKRKGVTYYAGEWSHRQAAIAAGLGARGKNRLLLTPEFGPHVRLGSILTTAELEPTHRELPEDPCGSCTQCMDACPMDALKAAPDGEIVLDSAKCRTYIQRPFINPGLWTTLKSYFSTEGFWLGFLQGLSVGYHFCCVECYRSCPRAALKTRKAVRGEVQPLPGRARRYANDRPDEDPPATGEGRAQK